ncbi:MAG: cytochrome c [Alphaproteobacteria bacterium]|nr:cytochrome c [Alphaproteobacteria bacterium]
MLLIALLAGCGGPTEYDIDTWKSPLASEYRGDGDATLGEEIYFNEHWEDTSPYALTCSSCHSADTGDTLTTDADDLTRPGHTVYNAPYRETWKGDHTWDAEDDNVIGAYGGQVCVRAYFPEGSDMTGEQATHLEAYMRTRMDASPAADDPRAEPLDFGFTRWETEDDFVASVGDGAGGWLYGEDLGDVANGEALTAEYCGACHIPEGESAPVFYGAANSELPVLMARIRRTEVAGFEQSNIRMPRVPADRLSDEDLADILAFLTSTRDG